MRGATTGIVMTLLATVAGAQTTDHYYRSWSWTQDVGFARAAGLGGSTVALEGDAGALAWNPAVAGTVKRSEILAGGLARAKADGRLGDTMASRGGVGFVGGAGLVAPTIAIGGYLGEPHAQAWTLASATLPDGSVDSGYLRSVVTEAGGVLAWRPARRVSLGISVSASHLELEGEWERRVSGNKDVRVGSSAGATKLTGTVGLLWSASETVAVGASVAPRVSYAANRTAVGFDAGATETAGSYNVGRPLRAAAGVSWRVHHQVLVVAQADYVRYSELVPAVRLGVGHPSEYTPSDAIEPRGGLEVSLPVAGVSVQLRTGVHYEGRSGLSYSGGDVTERAVFAPTERRVRPSCGASLVARRLRVDVAGELSDRPIITVTGGIAF